MKQKQIAVKLNARLERERRGLVDPTDPRNEQVITPANYGTAGHILVYQNAFIQAQIDMGMLIAVPQPVPQNSSRTAGGRKRASKSRGAAA